MFPLKLQIKKYKILSFKFRLLQFLDFWLLLFEIPDNQTKLISEKYNNTMNSFFSLFSKFACFPVLQENKNTKMTTKTKKYEKQIKPQNKLNKKYEKKTERNECRNICKTSKDKNIQDENKIRNENWKLCLLKV